MILIGNFMRISMLLDRPVPFLDYCHMEEPFLTVSFCSNALSICSVMKRSEEASPGPSVDLRVAPNHFTGTCEVLLQLGGRNYFLFLEIPPFRTDREKKKKIYITHMFP